MNPANRLNRMRWGVRPMLALDVAVSVTANVLHARTNPISQAIADRPPIALLLTVELISRIPIHLRGLAAVRIAATTIIAGIAAWIGAVPLTVFLARIAGAAAVIRSLPAAVRVDLGLRVADMSSTGREACGLGRVGSRLAFA